MRTHDDRKDTAGRTSDRAKEGDRAVEAAVERKITIGCGNAGHRAPCVGASLSFSPSLSPPSFTLPRPADLQQLSKRRIAAAREAHSPQVKRRKRWKEEQRIERGRNLPEVRQTRPDRRLPRFAALLRRRERNRTARGRRPCGKGDLAASAEGNPERERGGASESGDGTTSFCGVSDE